MLHVEDFKFFVYYVVLVFVKLVFISLVTIVLLTLNKFVNKINKITNNIMKFGILFHDLHEKYETLDIFVTRLK